MTVTARALEGYALEGPTTWTRKLTDVACPKGRLTLTSPVARRVKIHNRENAVLRIRVGSSTRYARPGRTIVIISPSGRRPWTARWDGLFSDRAGTIRVR